MTCIGPPRLGDSAAHLTAAQPEADGPSRGATRSVATAAQTRSDAVLDRALPHRAWTAYNRSHAGRRPMERRIAVALLTIVLAASLVARADDTPTELDQ